jgi:hypothetical protein
MNKDDRIQDLEQALKELMSILYCEEEGWRQRPPPDPSLSINNPQGCACTQREVLRL